MNIYRGKTVMSGSGIGSIFKALFKRVIPIAKQVGIATGKRLLEGGKAILEDVSSGKNLQGSVKAQFRKAGKDLLSDVRESLSSGKKNNSNTRRRIMSNSTNRTKNHKSLPSNIPRNTKKRKLTSSKPKSQPKRRKDIFS